MDEEKEIRILLVDDERLVRRSMEKTMLRAGYDVESAEDVRAGLELFREAREEGRPFDIAILDLHMPNFDGVDDPDAGLGTAFGGYWSFDLDWPGIVLTGLSTKVAEKPRRPLPRGARAYFVQGAGGRIDRNLIEEILVLRRRV